MPAPSPEHPLRGSCLCGGVRYEVTAPFRRANYCHCSRCRKHSGAGASVQGRVRRDGFRLLAGEELIRVYRPAQGMVKAFCAECGSSLFGGTWPEGPEVSIRLGTLDGDPGIRPQYHSHVASKAEWDELPQDGLPRFEEGPPPAPKELAVVRAWFDAISRGDERAVAAALADNVVVELNRPGFFGNGTFEGRSAALRWMADWYYEFAPGSYRAELVELIPAGEHVVAHATIRARGRTSEAETEMEVYYDFTIAGERIAAFGAFSERAEALRAAGLGPHES